MRTFIIAVNLIVVTLVLSLFTALCKADDDVITSSSPMVIMPMYIRPTEGGGTVLTDVTSMCPGRSENNCLTSIGHFTFARRVNIEQGDAVRIICTGVTITMTNGDYVHTDCTVTHILRRK